MRRKVHGEGVIVVDVCVGKYLIGDIAVKLSLVLGLVVQEIEELVAGDEVVCVLVDAAELNEQLFLLFSEITDSHFR